MAVRGDGRRGINLVLSAIAREGGGTVAFIADDEAGAGRCSMARASVRDAPGDDDPDGEPARTGAATFRKLADAGVNADLLLPVRVSDALFFAVICVDDQDKAREALGTQVIPPGPRPVALAAVPGLAATPGAVTTDATVTAAPLYPGTRRRDRLSSRAPGSRQSLTTTIAEQQPSPITKRKTDPTFPHAGSIRYLPVTTRGGDRAPHSTLTIAWT